MADPAPTPSKSKAAVFVSRTTSTLLLWGLVTATFVSKQPWAFLALLGVLTLISTVEYFRILRSANVKCFPRLGILVAVGYCGILYWHFLSGAKAAPTDLGAMAIFAVIVGSFGLQLRHPIRGNEPLVAVASTLLGFVYIAFLFNFAASIVFLAEPAGDPANATAVPGAFLLLWLLAVTKFSDMGAYIVGSAIGRHKMIPHVSPGKTWEGFAGALIFAQVAACGLYALMPGLGLLQNWSHVIILGFGLSILAVVGDLAESIIKRAVNAKDSGRMLPGIGGGLDLIDSICFTAPALYFYLQWILPDSP